MTPRRATGCTRSSRCAWSPRIDRAPEVSALFAYARDSIARNDSERELVRIVEALPGSLVHGRTIGSISLSGRVMSLAGRVLGNDRMRGCALTIAAVG